ncbi:Sirohydrochlorin ferrochelatase [Haloechinothrix alba]|uniref:Sirohydrochlorin ferrochelatase n=1 Tax=Haloechinothrix alba TaxID=664784 RepID=A0A238VYW8_9PSEU|nr:CbiX/SirB N-terminal domain-containing protein [Haloechinothrix alba]SNR39545.1 Sirohydrochlorin ferrochelatase [Haloechinothrix alba]
MLVLAAHGTRAPEGERVIEQLASRVRQVLRDTAVRVAYADVRAPSVTDVLAEEAAPAVVVPAFLGSGYHVRADIPDQVAASGHDRVALAPAFGPAPELIGVLLDRLRAAGYTRRDSVVLAAAGSTDPRALTGVHDAACALAARIGAPVRIGYAATAGPSVDGVVGELRAATAGRVAVASWLLAPGLFQRTLTACGADAVAEPLCRFAAGRADVPIGVVDLVVRRYLQAWRGWPHGAERPAVLAGSPAAGCDDGKHDRTQ